MEFSSSFEKILVSALTDDEGAFCETESVSSDGYPVLTLLPGPRVKIRLDPRYCAPFVVDAEQVKANLKFWRNMGSSAADIVAALEKAKAMIEAAQC